MSRGWFWTAIIGLTALMLLCASPLGVIPGFFAGIALMIVAAPILMADQQGSVDTSSWPDALPAMIGVVVMGMFLMVSLYIAYGAWVAKDAGQAERARTRFAISYAVSALPASLGLSLLALGWYWTN